MAHIVPSISFVRELKSHIERGLSVQQSLKELTESSSDEFCQKISLWYSYYKLASVNPIEFKSQYQKSLIDVVVYGLDGAPVYEHLCSLETEMLAEFERQWKAYLESLPLKLSVPLLLCFFPAYAVLLFGPLILHIMLEV